MFRTLLCCGLALLLPVAVGHGQIVLDGDFDDLPVGMAPDCGAPAGAWSWPDNYVVAAHCETDPSQFTVVMEPDGSGHCLHRHVDLGAGQQNATMYLPNLFDQVIEEVTDPVTIVVFDILVPEAGVSGGQVFVGGNHSGDGWSSSRDRAAQIGWQADGKLTASGLPDPTVDCPVTLLDPYPVGAWQTVRFEIDLDADTYDMFWAVRGDPFVQLLEDRAFHSAAELDHLDRFTVAHFDVAHPCIDFGSTHSYLDSLEVSVCTTDATLDGAVDVVDLLAVLGAWGTDDPAADNNDDGVVAVNDLLEVLASWGPCS